MAEGDESEGKPPNEKQSTPPSSVTPQAQNSGTSPENDKGSESEGDGAEEILEESPDKRWSKRREKVKQRDVPGIDAAYLAMDNETGNEVVWNEVQFSERKNFREQEEKLRSVFDNLTQLVHINLVKFHKYWTDTKSEKARIIFITEYMSSGSMSRFLHRARSSGTPLNIKVWRKWTTQILSALNYLHSCDPPIVHANLTSNTVFIQQNGLIKIGCVAPNAIHHHVKTFRENFKNMHYVAPEFDHLTEATTAADIYSFGICALEMATTGGLGSNGSTEVSSPITTETIHKAVESLEDLKQRDFIEICLNPDPSKRPTARELLFHQALFEVHSLKLLAAHELVNSKLIDQLTEDDLRVQDPARIAVSTKFKQLAYCEITAFQIDLDKFLEDVRNGIYPLIAFAPLAHMPTRMTISSSLAAMSLLETYVTPKQSLTTEPPRLKVHGSGEYDSVVDDSASKAEEARVNRVGGAGFSIGDTAITVTPSTQSGPKTEGSVSSSQLTPGIRDEGYDTSQSVINNPAAALAVKDASEKQYKETRSIVSLNAEVEGNILKTVLRLDDMMNRQLLTELNEEDTAEGLARDLVDFGLICETDLEKMCDALHPVLQQFHNQKETETNAGPDSGKCSRKSSRQHEAGAVVIGIEPETFVTAPSTTNGNAEGEFAGH